MFPILAHAAVNDLYWEVKLNALQFWKLAILRQFKYNGVIDGGFPAVTFSKELKKIVTLTPKEIMIRLNRILNELSIRGALGVLLECLNDDCDLEVVKAALLVIQKINRFLDKYNYREEIKLQFNPKAVPTIANNNLVFPICDTNYADLNISDGRCVSNEIGIAPPISFYNSMPNDSTFQENLSTPQPSYDSSAADQVIDSIVSLDDINLLVNAYENQLHVNSRNYQTNSTSPSSDSSSSANSSQPHQQQQQQSTSSNSVMDEKHFKKLIQITPAEYINRVSQIDLESCLNKRTDWIQKNESFDSLLDDVMFSMELADINGADCY